MERRRKEGKEGKEMKGRDERRMKQRGKMRRETKAAAYIWCDGVI